MCAWMEEYRGQAAGELFGIPRAEDADQPLRGRARWTTGEQSREGERERVRERSSMVDDCCGTSHVHEFHGKSLYFQ
jgi:hypothetical protein